MNRTIQAEKERHGVPIPDEPGFASIAVREQLSPETIESQPETVALDSFLSAVKLIFLYVPGAGALHFCLLAITLFFLSDGPSLEIVAGTLGILLVSMFMVVLGAGRLSDLRYLRVVGGILATSALAAVLYGVSVAFIPGDYFGWFTLLTLPVTLIIGYLIKLKTDRESLAE